MNLNNVELLSTYAERHGLDYKRLRRMARKNEFDAPFKFGKTWFIDADTPAPVIPERKRRTRDDGRTRFVVYIDRGTDDEQTRGMDELARIRDIVGVDNVIDMRDVRAARKLAKTIAETSVLTNGDMIDRADMERAERDGIA